MRTPLLTPVLALVVLASSAFAHDKNRQDKPWYFQFGGGAILFTQPVSNNPGGEVGYDAGWDLTWALGRDMGGGERWGWSLELEGYFGQALAKDEDLLNVPGAVARKAKMLAWLGNAVLDYHLSDRTALYLGGGVGYANRINFETFDQGNLDQQDTSGLAYTIKTGVKYNLGGRYDVLVGYRYVGTESLSVKNLANNSTFDIEPANHMLEVNVRFGL